MRKLLKLLALCLPLLLVACGGSGSSSSTNGGSPNTNYTLGSLPNGSTVYISQESFTVVNGNSTSGSIGLSSGTPGVSYTLSFSESPSNGGLFVSTSPSTCTITSGSGQTCQMNFNAESALSGNYVITVSYNLNSQSSKVSSTASSETSGTVGTFGTSVTGGTPLPTPGNLSISSFTRESISVGELISATVTLTGSQNVTAPVNVAIVSNNPSIATVSPNTCSLTTASNSCIVTLTGVSAGSVTFSASASSYTTITSESLTVLDQPPVLSIAPLLESTTIESNGASYALISRSGNLSNSVTIAVQSSNSAMSVNPESITLSANESSQYVRLTGVTTVNSVTLSAIANQYTESQVRYTITAAPLFSCVADISNPASPNLCGCLNENDESGLTWYADRSQTGTWKSWCTPTQDPGNLCTANGSSISTFNNLSHCGYSDWHLPSTNGGGGAVNAIGGNWGTIGTYAVDHRYAISNNLNDWLNTNGFTGEPNGFYWSSVSRNSTEVWIVNMSNGNVLYGSESSSFGVMLVRSGP